MTNQMTPMFNKNKGELLKLFEYTTSLLAVVSLLTYFCGYLILTSFFKYQFGQSFFLGGFIPPAIFVYLGLILVLSTIVALPFIFVLVLGYFNNESLEGQVLSYFVIFLYFFINPLKYLSKFGAFVQVGASVLIAIVLIFVLYDLLLSYKKKGFVYKAAGFFYHPIKRYKLAFSFMFPIIFPDLIEIFSKYTVGTIFPTPSIADIKINMIYTEFYFIFSFSLILFIFFIKEIFYIKRNYSWLRYLIVIAYILSFSYSFSNQIGKAIAENYKLKNSGIFPRSEVTIIEYSSKTNKEVTSLFLIAKDERFYYGFKPKTNVLSIIPLERVSIATVKK